MLYTADNLLLNIISLSQALMVLEKGTKEYSSTFKALTYAIAEASELITLGREHLLALMIEEMGL